MKPFLLLTLLAGCSQTVPQTAERTTPSNSRGLRADEHLGAARFYDERGDELSSWPERQHQDVSSWDDPNPGLWYHAFDQVGEQRHRAAIHESNAGALELAYEQACQGIEPASIRTSPLRRFGQGGSPTADGVIVILASTAGTPDHVRSELRCHGAWMMLSNTGIEESPLDLPDIAIVTQSDPQGISVELSIKDPDLVPELQRRVARELEVAARQAKR